MSIGGSSFNNGVNFMSDNYTARFVMQKDNSYKIVTEKRLKITGFRKYVRKVPLVKGLFSLFSGGRLIVLILALCIFEDTLRHSKPLEIPDVQLYGTIAATIMSLAVFAYIIKKILYKVKDTWAYHGAEHKTIYAHEEGLELTLENVKGCPRIARRCGTNFIVFFILFFTAFAFLIDYSSLILVFSYILAYELFDIKNGDKLPVIKLFFKLGYWCQQRIFTREPSDIQLLASIDAMNKLIEMQTEGDVKTA